ncbi:porin [Arcobacter sp. YIC-80]|uniref:porin n=1 Tax=Arcobacter sp. YIC-80 TaxID=3376683 RepID=UPI00384BF229
MKKIAKLSLVAAMAMTAANAGSLEEAIKGVDISGNFTFEYKDVNNDTATNKESNQENEYDLELTAKVPVNDMVKAIIKIDVNDEESQDSGANNNKNVDVEDAYFQFTTQYATINVGQQNIPGPFTDGQQGTGIVALAPVGPVTLAAGYFNNHTVTGVKDRNAMEVAALANIAGVNAEIWYADVDEVLDVYNVKASTKVGPVALMAQYTSSEEDAAGSKKDTELNVTAALDLDVVEVNAAYIATGDDNDRGVAIDKDDDATATWALEQLVAVDKTDADFYALGVNGNVTSNINLALDYAGGDYMNGTAKTDVEEILFTAKYQMSKNFKIRALYSIYEEEAGSTTTVDSTKGAIELKYSF